MLYLIGHSNTTVHERTVFSRHNL